MQFPIIFYIHQHTTPTHDNNNKEGVDNFLISVQFNVWIIIDYNNQGVKATPLSYRTRPCRDWWKAWCTFAREKN